MRSNADPCTMALMERQAPGSHPAHLPKKAGLKMLLAAAIILAIIWLVLFFAIHITSFAIHIIIILAIIALIAHLFTGRKAV